MANVKALVNIFGNLSEIVAIGLTLFFVFVVVRWTFTLLRNLPALNVTGMENRKWYVYGFFVPIIGRFVPIFIFQDIWKASDPDRLDDKSWRDAPTSTMMYVWYVCWFTAPLLEAVSARLGGTNSFVTLCCSCLVDIIGAVLAIKLIGRIDDRQDKKHVLLDPEYSGQSDLQTKFNRWLKD